MKKIITGKDVCYIGGNYEDKYYLLFDDQTGLEVSSNDYNKYQKADKYPINEHQNEKIIENFRLSSLMLGKRA
jgi:hypothetical protein